MSTLTVVPIAPIQMDIASMQPVTVIQNWDMKVLLVHPRSVCMTAIGMAIFEYSTFLNNTIIET